MRPRGQGNAATAQTVPAWNGTRDPARRAIRGAAGPASSISAAIGTISSPAADAESPNP